MKAIVLMFDSLNRHHLPPYGCDWTHAPNFQRLAKRTATFENSYVCSMPCMPARRDLHTARPNFLHRGWGPLEPFDDSVFEMLKRQGVHTHLATDHYHYFEDGGATYHTRYSTWEFFRGQEGDPWKGHVKPPARPEPIAGRHAMDDPRTFQDLVNRTYVRGDGDMPQARTMSAGLEFLRRNAREDRGVLQIETFDPHEPFFSTERFKEIYAEHFKNYRGPFFDWPRYKPTTGEPPELVEHLRYQYAALLAMCDHWLGKVLDAMDEHDLWKDTMLFVWTDHGFMLGEHECWAKCWQPFYQEIAHTPFFMWDPRCPSAAGTRRKALVQPSLDIGPTLLELFGVPATPDMLGKSLREPLARDAKVRDAAIFGLFGAHANVTDGRHVYMRATDEGYGGPVHEYTLMPAHMQHVFDPSELREIEVAGPLPFTKGCRVMKLQPKGGILQRYRDSHPGLKRTMLFDVEADPGQETPLSDPKVEARMVEHLVRLMRECAAPAEQFARLGLKA